jgi:hypothetical protein
MRRASAFLSAGAAIAAGLVAAQAGAQPPSRAARPVAQSVQAVAEKGWDGTVKGRQILAPLEITFENPADYDAFAAGRLPIHLTLVNAASRQTRRFTPAQLLEGFRRSDDRNRIMLYVLVSDILAPVWDGDGCVESATNAGNAPDGNGAVISVSFAPCGMSARTEGAPIGGIIVKGGRNPSAQRTAGSPVTGVIVKGGQNPHANGAIVPVGEGAQRTAGSPIGGLTVKGGKNPGGSMLVTPAPSDLGTDQEAMLRARSVGAGTANVVIVRSEKGAGSPKAQGF